MNNHPMLFWIGQYIQEAEFLVAWELFEDEEASEVREEVATAASGAASIGAADDIVLSITVRGSNAEEGRLRHGIHEIDSWFFRTAW